MRVTMTRAATATHHCARSLGYNNLTDGGKDMSGVLKLAKAAKMSKLERFYAS